VLSAMPGSLRGCRRGDPAPGILGSINHGGQGADAGGARRTRHRAAGAWAYLLHRVWVSRPRALSGKPRLASGSPFPENPDPGRTPPMDRMTALNDADLVRACQLHFFILLKKCYLDSSLK